MREEEIKAKLGGVLHIGKTVRIEYWAILKDGTYIFRRHRNGEVTGLYPHIFTARVGKHLESFRYTQFYEKGSERVKLYDNSSGKKRKT